MAPAIFFSFP